MTKHTNTDASLAIRALIEQLMRHVSSIDDITQNAEHQASQGNILGALDRLAGIHQHLLDALAQIDKLSIINKSDL